MLPCSVLCGLDAVASRMLPQLGFEGVLLLLFTTLLVPEASFIGHAAGLIAGFAIRFIQREAGLLLAAMSVGVCARSAWRTTIASPTRTVIRHGASVQPNAANVCAGCLKRQPPYGPPEAAAGCRSHRICQPCRDVLTATAGNRCPVCVVERAAQGDLLLQRWTVVTLATRRGQQHQLFRQVTESFHSRRKPARLSSGWCHGFHCPPALQLCGVQGGATLDRSIRCGCLAPRTGVTPGGLVLPLSAGGHFFLLLGGLRTVRHIRVSARAPVVHATLPHLSVDGMPDSAGVTAVGGAVATAGICGSPRKSH